MSRCVKKVENKWSAGCRFRCSVDWWNVFSCDCCCA